MAMIVTISVKPKITTTTPKLNLSKKRSPNLMTQQKRKLKKISQLIKK